MFEPTLRVFLMFRETTRSRVTSSDQLGPLGYRTLYTHPFPRFKLFKSGPSGPVPRMGRARFITGISGLLACSKAGACVYELVVKVGRCDCDMTHHDAWATRSAKWCPISNLLRSACMLTAYWKVPEAARRARVPWDRDRSRI